MPAPVVHLIPIQTQVISGLFILYNRIGAIFTCFVDIAAVY